MRRALDDVFIAEKISFQHEVLARMATTYHRGVCWVYRVKAKLDMARTSRMRSLVQKKVLNNGVEIFYGGHQKVIKSALDEQRSSSHKLDGLPTVTCLPCCIRADTVS